MRERIFRAKVKDKEELLGKGFPIDENGNLKSEWVFGVPIPRYPDLFLAWNEACNEYEEVNIIPETVGQYTSMTDKNGTKIFEGDILSAHLDDGYPENETMLKVVWHNNGWYGKNGKFFDDFDNGFEKYFEVIGNIHDNPELLKE
jgi:hypothetical protein